MKNEVVTGILKDTQMFWFKWREDVPERDSDRWEELTQEANEILTRYGMHEVARVIDGKIKTVSEYVAGPVLFWFFEILEKRAKEDEKKEMICKDECKA